MPRPAGRLILVRHAAVTVRPDRPPESWHLAPDGRAAAEALAGEPPSAEGWGAIDGIYTSPEPKAVATAQRIAAPRELRIIIARDLREVEGREWSDDGYREQVRRYLAGEAVERWEPRDAALARIQRQIDALLAGRAGSDIAVVSHGLALTLYVTDLLGLDPAASFELWSSMAFPDIAIVDHKGRRLERSFGERSAAK